MEAYCGESNALCEVASYDGGTDTMREVETSRPATHTMVMPICEAQIAAIRSASGERRSSHA